MTKKNNYLFVNYFCVSSYLLHRGTYNLSIQILWAVVPVVTQKNIQLYGYILGKAYYDNILTIAYFDLMYNTE